MITVEINGAVVELDEDGFVADPGIWTEDLARYLAAGEGVSGELGEEHWKVIRYLRDYYDQCQTAPMLRKLCSETGVSLNRMYQLFPSGPVKGALKVAGLPKPNGCV